MRPRAEEVCSVREFVVNLTGVTTVEGFLAAFNEGFCRHAGGYLQTLNWNAFHDYLSWPDEERYRLVFRGWGRIRGVSRRVAQEVFQDNPQVEVIMGPRAVRKARPTRRST
jgi:hypothetical protein